MRRGIEDVKAYLNRLRTLLRYGGVSHARWEEGSIRCDVNISVRREGASEMGVRTEMKNMNSLSAIERAIAYESARHIEAIEYGTERLVQETRGWDDAKGCSFSMRNKETAADYRYFPDPNLSPILIDEDWLKDIASKLPELPESRILRFQKAYGLSQSDAEVLTGSRVIADIFEAAAVQSGYPRETATWVIGELFRIARRLKWNPDDIEINTGKFAELVRMVADSEINRAVGRKALDALVEHGADPREFTHDLNLSSNSDADSVLGAVRQVLSSNADTVSAFLGGREKARQALIGAIMRELRGNGDPAAVNSVFDSEIEKMKGR